MKKKSLLIGIPVLVAIIMFFVFAKGKKDVISLETALVERGSIINTVTATGTIEPIDKIEVGTQVSGVINGIYADFNSQVKKGQLLAELDKSTLKARVLQSKASLASAQNELTYQEQNLNRTKKLYETKAVSDVDIESAQYKYNNAKASVDRLISELEQAEVNLSYASIYSPIDGVILARNVEEGQTVAASFSTPTLFTIARDLTKMKVEANVDEADIGQVKMGQEVTFTVDAFPSDTFGGTVSQIRLNPTVSSSVVTYKVIVEAPNPDLKLMPGLTASISIITKQAKNVFKVASKALQFKPDMDVAMKYLPKPKGKPDGMPNGIPEAMPMDEVQADSGFGTVWLKNGEIIKPQRVKVGMDDGAYTEIMEGLNDGDSVVTSAVKVVAKSTSKESKSPFLPTPPKPGNAKQ
ncbi:MAG TPA: efflux RND transporter periplasmic adaptor subunit [Tenuifilaceae bacterium]|nr:efflux RND transporter periplasmic adaptor subunit [Tenuifilaceae bacterium]HPI43909.1 efflux RND transporter periplasmic adaptor subunit [Tenuifilaceae bacterium]HPN21983.1 efflux RND transporter periplasmic adaptor subunit [Tenuifilaceae bacterium]HPV55900.1 efflux RND transporter periplasmic adaptor subunit [Tenuifilaceae bacterium]